MILRSNEDASINFVKPSPDGGNIEYRYVRRTEDTVIVYLSSASGCNKACRFCHLTQLGQTMETPVYIQDYLDQAEEILSIATLEQKLSKAHTVHFNFMARGDAMANPFFIMQFQELIYELRSIAYRYYLKPKFKISSIFPKVDPSILNFNLQDWVTKALAVDTEIEFYYSLYSLDPGFRKRWIPKGLDPAVIGTAFANTTNRLRLHHALIADQNDGLTELVGIKEWLSTYNIRSHLNIVRYNPHDASKSAESSEEAITRYLNQASKLPNITSANLITRVGRDVAATCGTFIV